MCAKFCPFACSVNNSFLLLTFWIRLFVRWYLPVTTAACQQRTPSLKLIITTGTDTRESAERQQRPILQQSSGGWRKERKSIYIAPFCTKVHIKRSGMDHSFTCKQHHACLSFAAFTRRNHHRKDDARQLDEVSALCFLQCSDTWLGDRKAIQPTQNLKVLIKNQVLEENYGETD